MTSIAGKLRNIAIALVVAASAAALASAQDYGYDVRLRVGGFFPANLPVKEGTIWGLEIRDQINDRNGITYGIGYFDEQRTEFMDLNFNGTPTTFTFHAKVKLQPLLFSWYHFWPKSTVNLYSGIGGGIYPAKATSAGLNRKLGVGVKDVGDFRFLQNESNFGLLLYAGADFFPESRWGIMVEGRGHFVSHGYSATEISTGGIFRF